MKKEVAVFAFIFVGMGWIIENFNLPYADEGWLLSSVVAALVAYWFRPNLEQGYLKFTGPILLVFLAGYLIVLKAPKLLSRLMNHRLAGLLCLAFYVSCCWIVIKQREKLKKA
jgi:hypothetical protein